jgi:hypothetical protein
VRYRIVESLRVATRWEFKGWADPAVAADGAGMTAFRGIEVLQPAPLPPARQVNAVVRRRDSGFKGQDFDAVHRRNAYQTGEKSSARTRTVNLLEPLFAG